jgi:elongation factor G
MMTNLGPARPPVIAGSVSHEARNLVEARIRLRRNVGVLAHVDAGKTTLTERLLLLTGRTHRAGEVHDGTTVTDFDRQERSRGITIWSAAVTCSWRGHDLTVVDTPGHVDFAVEVERSLRVLDGAVVVLDGVAGVEPQTEAVWRQADRYRVPRVVLVNKLDRAGSDLDRSVASLRDRLGVDAIAVHLPVTQDGRLTGLVDLVDQRLLTWPDGELVVGQVPPQLAEETGRRREALVEHVAALHEHAFDVVSAGHHVDAAALRAVLRDLVLSREVVVVLAGAAYRGIGVEPVLDAVVDLLPSPLDVGPAEGTWQGDPRPVDPDSGAPLVALAFKVDHAATGRLVYLRVYAGMLHPGDRVLDTATGRTERVGRLVRVHADRLVDVDDAVAGDVVGVVGLKAVGTGDTLCSPGRPVVLDPARFAEPVVAVAVEPVSRADVDRLDAALARLADADPTLRVSSDAETGQTLLAGGGELHLDVNLERLRTGHGLAVRVGEPRVALRETITGSVTGLVHRHVKQDGGAGQYAHIVLDVEPTGDWHVDLEFTSGVTGGRVPAEFVAAVQAGCRDALAGGPLGERVVGVRVRLTDGATHVRDSSEMAFRTAGRAGLKRALAQCRPVLLEPIAHVRVEVPEEFLGAVLGDLGSRRARVLGHQPGPGGTVTVTALVPLKHLFGYTTALRSRTQGRGTHTASPHGYDTATEEQAHVNRNPARPDR